MGRSLMSVDIPYDDLVRGLARCEHCGKMLGLADVKKTVPAASMGNVTAKIRIARCEKCGKESQFVSER
jgi:uncharacterized protein with PIN domain